MSNYQRLHDNNAYPGNAPVNAAQYPANAVYPATGNGQPPPPAYPQIDYTNRNAQPQQPMYQSVYQQQAPQGAYPIQAQYAPQTAQPVAAGPAYAQAQAQAQTPVNAYQQPFLQASPYSAYTADGQPVYNVYGGAAQSVYAPSYAVPLIGVGQPGHLQLGSWSDSLFSCFDSISICLLSCLVPCYRWALTLKRANIMSFGAAFFLYTIPILVTIGISIYMDVLVSETNNMNQYSQRRWMNSHASVIIPLYIVMVVSNLFVVLLSSITRYKLRQKYQIDGNCCTDCLAHFFCGCCAIAQEARHVDRDLALSI